uniref:Uncharacterized protein n=1 Tax=Meloidogyne hapla TaxID=6305 RepID=A0A1I8BCG5_MELHA
MAYKKLIFCFIFPKFCFCFLFNSSPTSDLLPCLFPSNPSELATFCQLPYHQVPLFCDPGGILSRTEAELIDRQLRTEVFNNLTSCICPLRPCIQKDKKLGQLRVFGLLVPVANGNSIFNCLNNSKNQRKNKNLNNITTINELNRLTGQFARISLDRLLLGSGLEMRERCDPDLFILYIDRWWINEKQRQPFIARIFRRNLGNLRDLSLVERVNGKGNPFELMNGIL